MHVGQERFLGLIDGRKRNKSVYECADSAFGNAFYPTHSRVLEPPFRSFDPPSHERSFLSLSSSPQPVSSLAISSHWNS